MKKIICGLCAVLVLQFSVPRKGQALLGGAGSTFTLASGLFIAGGFAVAGGGFYLGQKAYERSKTKTGKVFARIFQGVSVIFGVILLDDQSAVLELKELDEKNQDLLDGLGVSSDEVQAFNQNVGDINALLVSTHRELAQTEECIEVESIQEQETCNEIAAQHLKALIKANGDRLDGKAIKVASLLSKNIVLQAE